MTPSINVRFIGMITSQEIENSDFSRVTHAVDRCINAYKEKRELELITFGISGYENDNRALFDIPEVRKWSKAMYQAEPCVLDLLHPSSLTWLLPCIADIEIVNRTGNSTGWRFREDTREAFITQSVNMRMELCKYLAANQHEFDDLADAAFERFKSAIVESQRESPSEGQPFVNVYPHSLVVCTDLPKSFFSSEEGKYWLIANRNIAIGSFLGMQSRDEVDTFMAKLKVNTFICADCSISEITSGSVDMHATELVSAANEFVRSTGTTVENRQHRIVPMLCEDAFKKTSWVRYCWFFE
jgi:hypothetical protein